MLDAYALCPCGSGKKVRFCCSKDIQSDLGKVVRMIEGDQNLAAKQQVERLISKHGERMALLALKASLQGAVHEIDGMTATVVRMREISPDNPVALAHAAQLEAATGETAEAFELILDALENVSGPVPTEVYGVASAVLRFMLMRGEILKARGLLKWCLGMAHHIQDERPQKLFQQVLSSNEIPLILKDTTQSLKNPDDFKDAPWHAGYEACVQNSIRAKWRSAVRDLQPLLEEYPDELELQRAHAIVLTALGRMQEAGEAYRKLSLHPAISRGEALAAEAHAQALLEESLDVETWLDLMLTYTVQEPDSLMERLLSDKRVQPLYGDPEFWIDEEGDPPPKATFMLLDREPPKEDAEALEVDDLPRVQLTLAVFGRQTDRDARLKVDILEDEAFEKRLALLREVSGEPLPEPIAREETREVPRHTVNMESVHFPKEVSIDQRMEFETQIEREKLYNHWLDDPQPFLDGKTPRKAAEEASYALRLSAYLTSLEVDGGPGVWSLIDDLRSELGLSEPERVEIEDLEQMFKMSPLRWHRIQVDSLPDPDLVKAAIVASHYSAQLAVRVLAEAALQRESVEPTDEMRLRILLASVYEPYERALEILREGQQRARAAGISPGMLELHELENCFIRGDETRSRELLDTITTKYANDPQIAPAFMQLLVRYGLIRPDGSVPEVPEAEASEATATGSGGPGIWTPGQGSPAAGESGPGPADKSSEKGKLYLPGMD